MLASGLASWAVGAKVDSNRRTSVVLLLTGVITDGGWSQLAYDGLKRLQSDPRFYHGVCRRH